MQTQNKLDSNKRIQQNHFGKNIQVMTNSLQIQYKCNDILNSLWL